MPGFEQFLAVPCLYGVLMVKPESSEDGVSAKKLAGEGAADSQGSKELDISNVGHQGH